MTRCTNQDEARLGIGLQGIHMLAQRLVGPVERLDISCVHIGKLLLQPEHLQVGSGAASSGALPYRISALFSGM